MKQFQPTALKQHNWVTVINPTNQRMLLQACDDCGVVKSENSIAKACSAASGSALVTRSMVQQHQVAC